MASLVLTLITLATALLSWSGLAWVVMNISPAKPLALPGAYGLAFCGIASTAALLTWLVFRRRARDPRFASPAGYLGHAMLLATIMLFALWLQSLRMLTMTVAFLLAALYVCLELALLFGTRGSVELEVEPRALGGASVES